MKHFLALPRLRPMLRLWMLIAVCSAAMMTVSVAQTAGHHNSRHMHMKNWALEPTGIEGVTPLDPNTIPKWVNQLTVPPVLQPDNPGSRTLHYTIISRATRQQMLPPGFPDTKVFAYGGKVNVAPAGQRPDIRVRFSVPGPTLEAVRGRDIDVRYSNEIQGPHIFPVDPTIMFADPNNLGMPDPPFKPFPPGYAQAQAPVPVVTHLHGGVTRSDSDGFPFAWTTVDGKKGPAFTSSTFHYPNAQLATTLWFHDHTIGMTRLNVNAGLEATYISRENNGTIAPLLTS